MAMSNLTKRVLFSTIAIPIILFLLWLGDMWFVTTAMLISAIALEEYFRLARIKGGATVGIPSYVANGLIIGSFYFYLSQDHSQGNYLIAMILVPVLFAIFSVFLINITSIYKKKGTALLGNSVSLSGLIYITLAFLSLVGIREFDSVYLAMHQAGILTTGENNLHIINTLSTPMQDMWGFWFIVSIFAGIWGCDTGAYFIGKAIGKNKLLARVSPNKTWEGAIGGAFIGLAAFALIVGNVLPGFPTEHAIAIGAILVIGGQYGDLFESLLKRDAGVKDSSNLLPGHGGVLDRLDSLIFVLPLIFAYLLVITAR
jgi:phosphatidate cytidylyltransferase